MRFGDGELEEVMKEAKNATKVQNETMFMAYEIQNALASFFHMLRPREAGILSGGGVVQVIFSN